MKKIIWRSRVITILGFLILILAFDGFPEYVHQGLLVLFGIIIVFLGFSGNKYANQISHKYVDNEDVAKDKVEKTSELSNRFAEPSDALETSTDEKENFKDMINDGN